MEESNGSLLSSRHTFQDGWEVCLGDLRRKTLSCEFSNLSQLSFMMQLVKVAVEKGNNTITYSCSSLLLYFCLVVFFQTPFHCGHLMLLLRRNDTWYFCFQYQIAQVFICLSPMAVGQITASISCLSYPLISSSHPECGRKVLFAYRALSENICLYKWDPEGKRRWFPHRHSVLQWLMSAKDGRHLDLIPLPIWAHWPVCQALQCYIYSQFI